MATLDAGSPSVRAIERPAACAHCGLPVPAGELDAAADRQFCCAGCRAVWGALHECGLDRYYRIRERIAGRAQPARPSGRGFESFDDPTFRELYAASNGELTTVDLYLENVHCAACVWLVERLPRIVPGVIETRLDLRRRIVRVTWRDADVGLSAVARQLDRIGYPPHPCRGRAGQAQRRAEDRRWLIRLAVAGAAAGNAMVIAFALYGGMLHGMEPAYESFFRWASLGLCGVSLAWPGRTFFQRAVASLRSRTLHMDVPIALGLATGGAWSLVSTVRGTGEVYFESLTVLVFLLLAGRWIQERQQRAGEDAVELLFSLTPTTARLVEAGRVREVPAEALSEGDVIEVPAGGTVPADGTIVQGRSSLNRSLLTGESRAVAVGPGDAAHAGTLNIAAPLRLEVAAAGERTRVGRLMRLVEDATARRAPVARMADRLAGWFVAGVLGLAAATFALWLVLDPGRAVPSAMALLIVSCPCALALATPLAVVAAIGRAARCGILIKGGDVLERLGRGGLVLLDKTGTLTRGTPHVVAWHGPLRWQGIVAAVEARCSHHVARAVADAWEPSRVDVREVQAADRGVQAQVGGRSVRIGARSFVEAGAGPPPAWIEDAERAILGQAATPVFVAADGDVVAVLGVGDPLEPDAPAAVDRLRRLGWEVGILSGDRPAVVRAVAGRLGLPADACRGDLDPEQKLDLVRRASARRPVVMVGDGANDAAALAAATVGVAVRGGAECSLAAADAYVSGGGLGAVPELIRGSRRTLAVIRGGLVVSLLYNSVGVTLAMAGLVNPLVAAVLMPVSSLTVVAMAYRSRTFEVPR